MAQVGGKMELSKSPPYQGTLGMLLRGASVAAMLVLCLVLVLLVKMPPLGLKVLWYAIIPLAPLIFFATPSVWVNLCPLAILQSLPKRIGKAGTRSLKPQQQFLLMQCSWVLLYLLVPLRHFVFNEMAMICVATTLLLGLVAFASGLLFRGLGGWCSSLCPIRPVEMAYGLFTKEKNRPEACSACGGCLAGCPRMNSGDIAAKKQFNFQFKYWLYSFPGFVAGYFLVHEADGIFLVYVTVFGLAMLSTLLFASLDKVLKWQRTQETAVLLALATYYISILPKIFVQWGLL